MAKKGQYKSGAKKRTKQERAYDGSPARKKARAERNRARNKAKKQGKVRTGDGKVVNHKKGIKKHGVAAARKGGTSIQSQRASNKQGARIRNGKNKITRPRKKRG